MTVRMRAVLDILLPEGDLTVPEIAAGLHIDRQYVQLMINETLSSGFAMQSPNSRYKRSPLLRLTEAGRGLTRADSWREKMRANVARNAVALAALEAADWIALVVWECEIQPETLEALYERTVEMPVRR